MSIKERLENAVETLRAVEVRRAETGDSGIGRGIEVSIINRELKDLELLAESEYNPIPRVDLVRQALIDGVNEWLDGATFD